MRVSQISVYHQSPYLKTQRKMCNQPTNSSEPPKPDVNFKGKFGTWLGAVVGGTAVVATALVAAVPAIACLAGGGAFLGAVGMDAAEDAVNKKKDDN